jgi:hypothetical protein
VTRRADIEQALAQAGVSVSVDQQPGDILVVTFSGVPDVQSLINRLRGGAAKTYAEGLVEGRDSGRLIGFDEGYGAGAVTTLQQLLAAQAAGTLDATLTQLAQAQGVTMPEPADNRPIFLGGTP